ncbi:PAS domain-containing sensor histidine kinase [Maridesulfovibrio sp.]|uniref:PAS domain-containing sensor histidine kinase n=1 Tax=Maridesulfovibrio sp. TaxID=2795000 RepID=UPI0039F1316B
MQIKLFSAMISILTGATLGWIFSIFENHLVVNGFDSAAKLIPTAAGAILLFFIYICYIYATQNREAEKNIEYQYTLLNTISKTAPVGICLIRDKSFIHVNDYFCDMIGYTREELIEKPTSIIYPTEHDFQFGLAVRQNQMRTNGTGSIEAVIKCKNGTQKDVIINSTPLDKDDWSKGITFTLLDISKRKKAENELKQSYIELEKRKDAYKEAHRLEQLANVERSNFQDNMCHEIRTPLNGILGMLQILQLKISDKEDLEYIDYTMASCKRLANLLQEILEYSRLQEGRVCILHKPFCLPDIFEETRLLFELSLRQKGLDFHMDILDGIPDVLIGDHHKLQQILNNLVGNAVKFTNQGSIRIEAWPVSKNIYPEKCRILFSVSDTGIGIADDKLEYIFKAYSQADSSNTRSYDGAGLGLTIVKRLLDTIDGNIYIESKLGTGTEIIFCIEFKVPTPGIDY